VGATAGRQVSVRIVAATNVDLPARVAAGGFRSDLYYRLMHFHAHVPPLRERREDIPALAAHFVKRFATEMKRKPQPLRAEALDRLLGHDYPGNIRELRNTIERAIIYSGGESVRAEHIVFAPKAGAASAGRSLELQGEVGPAAPFNLVATENRMIERALLASGGNVSAAARLLGVDRAKIYRWRQLRKNAAPADLKG